LPKTEESLKNANFFIMTSDVLGRRWSKKEGEKLFLNVFFFLS